MCVVGDFAKGSIVATVRKKLETFSARVSSMMYVAVHVKRSHSCFGNASRSASQVAAGIVTEIRTRADPLLTWLSWSSCLTSLFLLLIIFRAKYYQQMFETRSRFDNRYVTKELRDLDLRRLRQGRETVLPLNTRERAKYVSTTSFRLLASERVHLTRSIVFMIITTFKLLIHMVADYSLYWVLMNIRFHGRFQTVLQPVDATAGVKVAGSGPLSGIVRGLIDALSVPLAMPSPSPISCLPNPHPPDFQRYAQIGILILLLWLCALCEPYGLRLRHVIMGHYQPERARARASWLYNHIIRTRGCFLKYARRKLHRDYKHSTDEKQTFKRWLTNIIPCRCLRYLLGLGQKEPHCLLCGTKQLQNDPDTYLKRCETPTCPGIYCARCFLDIGQLCTICLSPSDYGDLSDVSLEKWSSEDSDDDDSDDDRRRTKEPLLRMTDQFSGVNKQERLSNNNNNTTRTNRSGIFPKTKDQSSNQETLHFFNNNNFESIKEINGDTFKNQDINKKQLEKNNDLEQSVKKFNTRVVVRDADRLLKSVEAPKEKLSGIMNTMRLLTKKMDAGEIRKEWKKHDSNKFEYLVMELFQPIDIFKKALFVRHVKHANGGKPIKYDEKDESLEEVIPFLRAYEIDNKKETNVNNVLIDGNMHDSKTSENIVDIENKELLHSTKSKTSVHKRDIKGIKQNYVKLKQTISADVMKLRKRRIYFSKVQFIPKRRRRNHPKKCIILQTIRVGKSLNESVESEIKYLKAKLEFEMEKLNSENKPKKTKKVLDRKTFNANIRKLSSNIISDVSSDINASDMKDEPSTPEENNRNKNKDAGQANHLTTIVHKTQDSHSKCVLHGLCSKLWRLARGNHTPQKLISSSQQDESSTNDIANHKRRKKPLTPEQKHANKTTMLNNDARNYRISVYLKEQEWLKKQSDSDPPEHLNDVLKKLKRKAEKRKIKEAEILKKEVQKNLLRELKLKAKAELKLKKQMKKQLIAEEKKKHREQKKLMNVQTVKQVPKTTEKKKHRKQKTLSKIKEEVLPEESSISFAEKLLSNVVKEMSSSDKVRLTTPKICLSNNLNFYGFNNPVLDLPEENLNLDEIFGEEKQTIEKDTASDKDSKVNNTYYHDVAEKHQCQPNYWPYDRYGGTQTGIEEEKNENTLDGKAENYKSKKKRGKVENTTKKITAKSIKSAVSEVYVEMKKPVTKMRNFCSCIKERTASKTVARQVSPSGEKAIHVVPITISRSCQDLTFPAIFNKYTQSHVTKVKHCPTQCESDKCFCEHDVGVAAEQETCTCAAQCTLRCQGETVRKVNVGTMHNNAYKRTTNVAIQYEHYRRCVNQGICELCENPKFPLPKLKHCQCHPCGESAECPSYVADAEDDRWNIPCEQERTCTKPRHKRTRNILCQCDPCGDCGSGSGSCTSIFCESDTDCTGNTMTDTICTHVAIDYNDKPKRRRVKVVKKSNQSTTTDKQTLVDVSTITGDWWSPIVERKKNITLEKKTGDYSINQKEKMMEDKSNRRMSAKRFAPIKNHEHHKTKVNDGILSPSKYILECQENDYELFSPSIPPIVAMTCVKKLNEERSNYGYGAHRHSRKGHKSKRLEESYSPRKKTETSSVSLSPAKWRPVDRNEDTSHALKHYRRRNDKLQSSQKSRAIQKGREKASRASKNFKRLHVTRSFTDNEKEGDSVAGHCNSTSSLAIT
ncbi:uncharacterized protein isoform X2 [Choristoneura fumiferana]|uniref:uncharacterized protein isoform X2 n=1 Tax=Choristoneura fumiferana TaxID=7141 RepID=UPI003D154C3C